MNTRFVVGGRPGAITLGANYESQNQQRRGYVNNNGMLGDLRRDESNSVSNTDGYLQIEFSPWDPISLLAGYRYSDVRFKSNDHYITNGNPDDSGDRAYSHGSPVVGALWHVTDRLNVYANYGQGFETPTFIELAYRPVGSGLNFALQPAVSNSGEVGLKALIGRDQRLNLAAFDIRTSDEIVINTATGGRTTYKNAAKTERKGFEAAWQGNLGAGFAGYASYTYLSAKFTDATTTGVPPQIVPAGARLPGVPASSAYGELSWTYPQWAGFNAALEVQYAGQMYVNDRNTDAAPAWTIAQPANRLRAAGGSMVAARIRAAQQPDEPQLRRVGDRRRHQQPLFRTVGDAQFPGRRQCLCHLLTARRATRARRSRCIGWWRCSWWPRSRGAGGCRKYRSSRSVRASTRSTSTNRSA